VKVLLAVPYWGGSHRAWAEGYRDASTHDVEVVAHEARFWKWRMQGAFVTLAEEARRLVESAGPFDVIVGTSTLHGAAFLGALGASRAGSAFVVYMHENQLTYPLSPLDREDETYAMINWASMTVADAVIFNSNHHLESWFEAVVGFTRRFPDHTHTHLIESVAARSSVLPVGVDLGRIDPPGSRSGGTTRILWNHRWDHDKGPDDLVDFAVGLVASGADFELAVCGEQFVSPPAAFERLPALLSDRLVHFGHADEMRYVELLRSADVVVSTARQEFFGVAITEAVYAGAFPVLPNRLVYPERIPERHHLRCLYEDGAGMVELVRWVIEHPKEAAGICAALRAEMARFDWKVMAPAYDATLMGVAEGRRR